MPLVWIAVGDASPIGEVMCEDVESGDFLTIQISKKNPGMFEGILFSPEGDGYKRLAKFDCEDVKASGEMAERIQIEFDCYIPNTWDKGLSVIVGEDVSETSGKKTMSAKVFEHFIYGYQVKSILSCRRLAV